MGQQCENERKKEKDGVTLTANLARTYAPAPTPIPTMLLNLEMDYSNNTTKLNNQTYIHM